jgi:CHAT domain-containing protein
LQAESSFPSLACDQTARDVADLRALPGTRAELDTSRRVMGADEGDERIGDAFTAAAVQSLSDQGRLKDYKVLHFAAHALLPGDLKCQTEPAIVTSVPPDAADANAALLTASAIERMELDAELVILSACNSGAGNSGAGDGSGGGESLSGLARSFFAAGARAMVVTHWYVEDSAASALISTMLREWQADRAGGVAGALRTAQLRLIDRPEQPAWRHPFYWAPFALLGEGGGPQ